MDRDFDEGFYGEQFARFEEWGEDAALTLLRTGGIVPQDRDAVLVWLGRKAKTKAFRANVALALSVIALVVSIISAAVAIMVAYI